MPQVPIIMPQLGESIAEATIISHLVQPGQSIDAGQDVLEVETNKASMNVSSPCSGRLVKWLAKDQQSYPVGAVLGLVEVTAEEVARLGLDTTPSGDVIAKHEHGGGSVGSAENETPAVEPRVRGLPVPAHAARASFLSPRLKARIHELGLHAADLAGVAGSGAGGRITVDDFERFIANLEKARLTQASTMRVAVADAMRRSWTRPIAHVGLIITLDPLLAHRKVSDPKPGPALYALRALAIALAENSAVAGRLIGNKIVHPQSIDLSFAVEAEDGVLVPVLRKANQRLLKDLIAPYNELVALARQRKLPADATGGSIATVTNYGTFGLIWATPIPLPEQTLVLGLGSGRRAPFWDERKQVFVPVTEAHLTLSFDHRVLDGGAAGRLLTRVSELMARPDQL